MSAEAQPSQEELQAYLEQMRDAEPAEIVAQAFQILAMGAEVKLGRPDARVLIDMLLAMTGSAGDRLPANLATGMKNAVGQLQMAQVQAERQQGTQQPAEAGSEGAAQPGGQTPPPPGAQGQTGPGGQGQTGPGGQGQTGPGGQGQTGPGGQGGKMTDRLWIPGR